MTPPDEPRPFVAVVPVGPAPIKFLFMRWILYVGGWIPSFRLARLPIIHFAEWGLLRRYRGRFGLPGRAQRSLVFVSVFDGDVDEYIIALASLIRGRFDQAFGMCSGYPRRAPRSTLLAYIRRHEHDTAYFYRRYPGTVRDVRAAAALASGLDAVGRQPHGVEADRRLAELAQLHDIGPVAAPRPTWASVVRGTLLDRDRRGSFTTLAAVRPDVAVADLDERLRALDPRLFDPVPGTHYARFTIIDRLYDADDRLMVDAPAYLLFSAQHDIDPDERGGYPVRLANEVQRHRELRDALLPIWAACEDTDAVIRREGGDWCADASVLMDFLRVGAIDTGLFLSGTVPGTVEQLAAAIAVPAELDAFLADASHDLVDGAAPIASARRRRSSGVRPATGEDLRSFLTWRAAGARLPAGGTP